MQTSGLLDMIALDVDVQHRDVDVRKRHARALGEELIRYGRSTHKWVTQMDTPCTSSVVEHRHAGQLRKRAFSESLVVRVLTPLPRTH